MREEPLDILYKDAAVVVINKPAGLLVHRSALARGETRFAMQLLRDQLGQHVFPVHRLDRPTSGALAFALSSETARRLAQSFGAREVRKRYLAIVRGIAPESVTIDHPLLEEHDEIADAGADLDKPAQSARTLVRRLASVELPFAVDRYPTSRYSLVEAEPLTGRKHQVRRHLRHLGHPIIGDVNHGVGKHNRFFAEELGVRRLLLACVGLEFAHPDDPGVIVKISAPLAPEFRALLERFGWVAHAPS